MQSDEVSPREGFSIMDLNLNSVNRAQLCGSDQDLQTQTRFSTWTPLNHKTSNLQVCSRIIQETVLLDYILFIIIYLDLYY